ncbi:MAG: heavy metal translocating P-type ATPase [Halanaerobiales bacterium]
MSKSAENMTLQKDKIQYKINGLDCANCAAKIEEKVGKLPEVEKAELNFLEKKLTVLAPGGELREKIQEIADRTESGLTVERISDKRIDDQKEKIEEESLLDLRLVLGGGLFVLAIILFEIVKLEFSGVFALELLVYGVSYLLVGGKVLKSAVQNIIRGQVFNEQFLMSVATLGAFGIREYPEGVAVMLFYMIGEKLQNRAVGRSRHSIKKLMDIRPEFANLRQDGSIMQVEPERVRPGEIIVIKPGEKVPLDGKVIEGSSTLDTSALTGESLPRTVETGDEVLSGMVNESGLLEVEVTSEYETSTVNKILHLVEEAASRKAPTEQLITKFARYYTPVVVLGAVVLALVPPLFLGASFHTWIYRSLVFLVISCPCALMLSIPLAFYGGIGRASREGVLVKGGNFLEGLNNVDKIIFDKTGTLTRGVLKISEIKVFNDFTGEELLRFAALAEAHSSHPIARSLKNNYEGEITEELIDSYRELSGYGIEAEIKGRRVLLGNRELFEREELDYVAATGGETVVYVHVDGSFAGYIALGDELKHDAREAIQELKKRGIKETIMLTGDRENVAAETAEELEIDKYYAELLPGDKVELLEEIMKTLDSGSRLAFVGDGINDAPVLARADIGISMGALGSDAAIEAADVVLITDELSKLSGVLDIAARTRRIVRQNVSAALGIKTLFVVLGALGVATIWEAVFADVGVALLAVFNALRIIRGAER